jgi:tetratricopeptide (TPR) repeat protein
MTLEELDQDVERFALDCLAVSHAELFSQVWDDWQHVEQLLDARQSLKDRAHLTLLGGQLTYFLARLSFNLGDYAAARRHAVLAWEYAEDVSQPVLCASVRTLQGTIAYYAGKPQRSLDLLRAAEPYDTPYTRARIAANTARAHAALGDRPGAERALATMERHLVDVPVQPGDSPYTPGTAMSALASTLVRLGDGEAAEAYARQAVALHNLPNVKDRLFEDRGNATLNLATSLVVRRSPNLRKQHGSVSRRSPSPACTEPRPSAFGRWSCVSCWTAGARARGQGLRRATPRVPAAGIRCLIPAAEPLIPEAWPTDGNGACRVGTLHLWRCRAGPHWRRGR